MGLARSEGSHVYAVRVLTVDGIHADAIPKQRPARPEPSGIDGEDGDLDLRKVIQEAADDFVREGRFACAPCAGNAEDGNFGFWILDFGFVKRDRGAVTAVASCLRVDVF